MFIKLASHSGYITINISSPNTIRDFHDHDKMENLLKGLNKIKKDKKINQQVFQLSPDINDSKIAQ